MPAVRTLGNHLLAVSVESNVLTSSIRIALLNDTSRRILRNAVDRLPPGEMAARSSTIVAAQYSDKHGLLNRIHVV